MSCSFMKKKANYARNSTTGLMLTLGQMMKYSPGYPSTISPLLGLLPTSVSIMNALLIIHLPMSSTAITQSNTYRVYL